MSFFINIFRRFIDTMLQLFNIGSRTIKNTLNIYIKTNTGTSLSVDLDPKMDIKEVKNLVAPKLGMQPQEVKIIFAGKELLDSTIIEDCDLGEQSILHAVSRSSTNATTCATEKYLQVPSPEGSKPLCETLVDLQLTREERQQLGLGPEPRDPQRVRAHFYVYCGSTCHGMRAGKLRVRCSSCRSGALTVERDPCDWEDVLRPERIVAACEAPECTEQPRWAHFYFRCAEHVSTVEHEAEEAVALYLIKNNIRDVPCLACTDIRSPVLVFPCSEGHVTCLECFRAYCVSRLRERRFISDPKLGYTLPCPAGCENSLIAETHHFRLLTEEQYAQYQRFGAEEFVLQAGGVLCPQPGCGAGILVDQGCAKVCCAAGCGYVFCRKCLQGYHIGDCEEPEAAAVPGSSGYSVDPGRAAQARWDEASKITIKVITKPCPKCRTPTERDGGCMHMVCTRAQCGYHWCWVCQTPWTRECMGNHWFG